MEITNFDNLVKGNEYIVFIKPDDDFSINKAFNSLGIGTFDGIQRPGGIFNKLVMTNMVKWDGQRIRERYYPPHVEDVLLIRSPRTDDEYTEMVRIIEGQIRGRRMTDSSREILDALKNGTSPINRQNLHYQIEQPPQPNAPPPPPQENIPEDYECPICLENIVGDGIKTRCGHTFHRQCAESVRNNTCPLCRQNMRPFSNVGGKSRRKKRGSRRTKTLRKKHSKKHSKKRRSAY